MFKNKLKKIKLLLLDVDGVMTEGNIIYNDNGTETKIFNVKDGLGLRLLMDSGILTGIVTGRSSNALRHRCKNLGINYIFDGISDKGSLLNSIIKKTSIPSDEIAFAGDDLPDIPLLKLVGLSIAVADAHEKVKEHADMITVSNGGRGAVREICETILMAKGLWEQAINDFIK